MEPSFWLPIKKVWFSQHHTINASYLTIGVAFPIVACGSNKDSKRMDVADIVKMKVRERE